MHAPTEDEPVPRAKNPEIQDAFECAYKWAEAWSKRVIVIMRNAKSDRENSQRRHEYEQIKTKSSKFPPYTEIGTKFAQKDNDLHDLLRATEENYLQELERFASRFAPRSAPVPDAAKPLAVTAQAPAIAALEAKVAEISQLALNQAGQIQELLEAEARSRQASSALEKRFESIKSEHDSMKEAYISLKSERQALQSQMGALDEGLRSVQSQQTQAFNESRSFKQRLKNLQTGGDKAFEVRIRNLVQESRPAVSQAEVPQNKVDVAGLETKLNEVDASRKRAEADLEEWIKKIEAGFQERTQGIEAGLGERIESVQSGFNERFGAVDSKLEALADYEDVKDKLDELDTVTLNELCEAWVSSDHNLKAQYEEYKAHRKRKDKSPAPVLGASPQASGHVNANSALTSQQIESTVTSKLATALAGVEKATQDKIIEFCEQKDSMLVEIIEDGLARIAALETAKPPGDRFEARIQLLEQWKATTAWSDRKEISSITERLGLLESRSKPRMDRIELELSELTQKLDTIKMEVGQLVKRDWVELRVQEALTGVTVTPGLSNEVSDALQRIAAVEQQIRVIDSQFQNLTTKQLAEHISKLINANWELRLAKLEGSSNQLHGKIGEHGTRISRLAELIQQLQDFVTGNKKRPLSPSIQNVQEEINKRRRTEANNRHASPLQQQQQQQQQQPIASAQQASPSLPNLRQSSS
ncbi:hypothetical protein F5Y17DRAFT_448950 [Xylariaceae sp. FL0594]|nr:hypothetical protein F5Y17DRAFT_448950 [Xylariaceae sp. FL0594]